MNDFILKKNQPEKRIGQILSESRQQKRIRIEEVSRKLGIKTAYLEAIEADRFDLLPAGLYGRNFLKKYAAFLKEDSATLSAKLKELDELEKDDPFSKKIVEKKNLIIFPKVLRSIIFIIIIITCFLYLASYARKIAAPPALEITNPSDNLLTNEKTITIEGNTEAEAELRINGELVLNNNDGKFFQEISLKKGLNSINVSAKKKYSKENIVTRQILVE